MVNTTKHHRRSIRLKDYDYSQAGSYFVTICTHDKESVLGEIIDGDIHLNEAGKIVKSEWLKTGEIRKNVILDSFIIMPNHVHGIIIIIDIDNGRGTVHRAPTTEQFAKPTSNSIPTIIRSFKATTTKQINELRNSLGSSFWQRNYVACPERSRRKRVIRNEKELNRIRGYIIANPVNWTNDKENPQKLESDQ